jgi:hypothetical protein
MSDKMTGESEMGYCMGQLMDMDPTFSPDNLERELEEDLIPLVVTAYLRPDPEILKKVTEENVRQHHHHTITNLRQTYV